VIETSRSPSGRSTPREGATGPPSAVEREVRLGEAGLVTALCVLIGRTNSGNPGLVLSNRFDYRIVLFRWIQDTRSTTRDEIIAFDDTEYP
jgi:hypothetical protein